MAPNVQLCDNPEEPSYDAYPVLLVSRLQPYFHLKLSFVPPLLSSVLFFLFYLKKRKVGGKQMTNMHGMKILLFITFGIIIIIKNKAS